MALAIATGLGLDPVEFRASKGWLQRIKSRCRLHQLTSSLLDDLREAWQESIARYDPKDVYTIDETALFYRTVRLKPLVIGTEARPQSFPESVERPMNTGIIRAFKACYRRLWVEWIIQEFDNNRYDSVIDYYQAFIMLGKAWSQVKSSTFVNCWRKTGIVPKVSISQALDATRFLEQEGRDEREEIQSLLYSAYSGVEFTNDDIEQFISDPEEFEETVHEEPTIDELVAVAMSKMKLLEEEEEDTEMDPSDIEYTPVPEVSLETATVHAKSVYDYLVMNKPKVEVLKAINIVRAHLEEMAFASKKQTTLDSFRTC
ncbi:hypothetical protein BGZ98_009673 [Dissophora globulifera]|nr:hypothetical protein BGZ98_009673 [Dissophora globulifera]